MKILKKLIIITLSFFFLISCKKESEPSYDMLSGWEISKLKHNLTIHLNDLFFLNPETGFVAGFDGKIFKTSNAGLSWEEQNSGTTLALHSIFFLDENIGFASGTAMNGCLDADCDKGCVFLKTLNGGKTWEKSFDKNFVGIYSLYFFDNLNGLALIHDLNSLYCHPAKTFDGGKTWKVIDLEIETSNYDKFHIMNNVVYVKGRKQEIYKSRDKGETWEVINTPIPANFHVRNMAFFNENIGFIDGVGNMYKTIDGGNTWKEINTPFDRFEILHCYNENEIFNVLSIYAYEGGCFPTSKGDKAYQTFDGGEHWIESELFENIALCITCFPKKGLGYGMNLSEFYIIRKKE